MELAMPVYHPTLPGHVLLRPGFMLDGPAIDRLTELHLCEIWIKYPALESVVRYIDPAVMGEHAAIASLMGRTLDRVREPLHANLDFKCYALAVRQFVDKLTTSRDAALLVNDLVSSESPLAMHSGNTCFLSLLMGLKLESYLVAERPRIAPAQARSVENLGLGALLHDIGVLRLDPVTLERFRQSGDEGDPAYQRHARLGYEIVQGKVEPTAAATVLQHHQRFDGRGYPRLRLTPQGPRGLAGSEIHVFARIVAVADWFDRLRNPNYLVAVRPGEERRPPMVRVLARMLKAARARTIDPIVFKALLHVVPAFAPGTIVRLTDGRAAVVLSFDALQPCRPTVQALKRTDGDLRDDDVLGEVVDLQRRRDLRVLEAEGTDVRADFFESRGDTEFDLRVIQIPPAPGGSRPIQEPSRRAAVVLRA